MEKVNKTDNIHKPKRINSSYLLHEIQHLLHLESGFLFTVQQLFIRPGELIRNFIIEDRSKVTKPIIFLIFSATLFTIIFNFLHIEFTFLSAEQISNQITNHQEVTKIVEWINAHFGYASLFISLFIAIWVFIFFRKHNYNVYEIMVLLCFAIGQALLIIVTWGIIVTIFKINTNIQIGVYVGQAYIIWCIGQFFGKEKILNYFKSIVCSVLGVATFILFLKFIVYLLHSL